jgi:hypothetical protein
MRELMEQYLALFHEGDGGPRYHLENFMRWAEKNQPIRGNELTEKGAYWYRPIVGDCDWGLIQIHDPAARAANPMMAKFEFIKINQPRARND